GAGGRDRLAGGQVDRTVAGRVAGVVVQPLRLRQRHSGDLGVDVTRAVALDGHRHTLDVLDDLFLVVAAEVGVPQPGVRVEHADDITAAVHDGGRLATAAVPDHDQVTVVTGPVVDRLWDRAPAAAGLTFLPPHELAVDVQQEEPVVPLRAAVDPVQPQRRQLGQRRDEVAGHDVLGLDDVLLAPQLLTGGRVERDRRVAALHDLGLSVAGDVGHPHRVGVAGAVVDPDLLTV